MLALAAPFHLSNLTIRDLEAHSNQLPNRRANNRFKWLPLNGIKLVKIKADRLMASNRLPLKRLMNKSSKRSKKNLTVIRRKKKESINR